MKPDSIHLKSNSLGRQFDIGGADVGAVGESVLDDVRSAEVAHASVVVVQYRVTARPQGFYELPLRRRDTLDRLEVLDVRVTDVGHHGDIRRSDLAQRFDLAAGGSCRTRARQRPNPAEGEEQTAGARRGC
jgi:hypothetical protein